MDFYLNQLTDEQLDTLATLTGATHELYRTQQIEAIAYQVWVKGYPIAELVKLV